ncbi:MAG: exodeoxyribonuclease VII small subunit [Betaproteobacteria bacterium]|nr:exodeoxyribonuclease VII small subunit [Betaproteobacteria bacterium]
MNPSSEGAVPETFEHALAELEGIVATMEGGTLSLEDSLAAYRRGTHLLRFCQKALEDAQAQVRVLEGNTLQDFAGPDNGE